MPLSIQELIDDAANRWKKIETSPDSDLLRLVIARTLVQTLHAEKSRILSKGIEKRELLLNVIEKKLEDIRDSQSLPSELLDILNKEHPLKKKRHELPAALLSILPPEKFDRYDRKWEKALASEACSQGWSFWTLEARLELSKIDYWNKKLIERLSPFGVTLFIESVSLQDASDQPGHSTPIWWGKWILILKSPPLQPDSISADLNHWEGIRSPVVWKHIYP